MYLCIMCALERILESLELELKMAVSYLVVSRN